MNLLRELIVKPAIALGFAWLVFYITFALFGGF